MPSPTSKSESMTPPGTLPLGSPTTLSFPAYYDMHSIPARRLALNKLPEQMLPDGTWKLADPEDFGTKAHRVSPQVFQELMAEWTKASPMKPSQKGPDSPEPQPIPSDGRTTG